MDSVRIATGIGIGAAIYYVGLYLVPDIWFIRQFVRTSPISSGEVTQAVYLVVSMTLMLILSKGRLSRFGFRWPAWKPTVLAVLLMAGIEVVLLIGMMVSVSLAGPRPMTGQLVAQMATSIPQTIITVWLIASTCEELFYRGFLYGYLEPVKHRGFRIGKLFISLPVTICALMFGLGHLCVASFMPPVMVANIVFGCTVTGFITGYIRERTGSILPAILVHMTANIVGCSIPWLMGG